MPDLFTHAATGYFIGRSLYADHRIGLIVLGSILPDLLTRVPQIILQRFLELPVSHFFAAFHTPVALIISCYLLCFLFAEAQRRTSCLLMSFGALCHFVLDLMQEQQIKEKIVLLLVLVLDILIKESNQLHLVIMLEELIKVLDVYQ